MSTHVSQEKQKKAVPPAQHAEASSSLNSSKEKSTSSVSTSSSDDHHFHSGKRSYASVVSSSSSDVDYTSESLSQSESFSDTEIFPPLSLTAREERDLQLAEEKKKAVLAAAEAKHFKKLKKKKKRMKKKEKERAKKKLKLADVWESPSSPSSEARESPSSPSFLTPLEVSRPTTPLPSETDEDMLSSPERLPTTPLGQLDFSDYLMKLEASNQLEVTQPGQVKCKQTCEAYVRHLKGLYDSTYGRDHLQWTNQKGKNFYGIRSDIMMQFCFDYIFAVKHTHQKDTSRKMASIHNSLIGMRKFVAWLITLEEYEMRDAIEPGFVSKVLREKDNCINEFCEYQYSDLFQMRPITVAQTLKNLSTFLSRIDEWFDTIPGQLQTFLKESYEWLSSRGLAKTLQGISTSHERKSVEQRVSQNQLHVRRADGSHLEQEDITKMKAVGLKIFVETAIQLQLIERVESAGTSHDTDVVTTYNAFPHFDEKLTENQFNVLQAMVLWCVYLGTRSPQRVKLLIDLYDKEIKDEAINVHCFKRGKRGKSSNHRHVFKIKYKCGRTALNIWIDLQNKATQAFKEALIQSNNNPEMQTYNIFTQVKKKNARSQRGILPSQRTENFHKSIVKDVGIGLLPAINENWIRPIPDFPQMRRNLATNVYLNWRRTKGFRGTTGFQTFLRTLAKDMDTSVSELLKSYIYAPILQTFSGQVQDVDDEQSEGDDPDVDEEYRHFPPPPTEDFHY
jgi:hypothetical protein